MTLTSTGPSGFQIKAAVTVLAVVAFVAGAYAISQQFSIDSQPNASAATGAVIATADPYTGPSGLSEAYAAGKLDAGLNPVPGETLAGSEPAPEVIVIEGQGSLYDALVEGKYDAGSLSGVSGAQYVLSSEAAASNGLTEALATGKLDAEFALQPSEATTGSEPAPPDRRYRGKGSPLRRADRREVQPGLRIRRPGPAVHSACRGVDRRQRLDRGVHCRTAR